MPEPVLAKAPWRGAGLVSLPQACGDIATLGLSWYYDWWTGPICPDPTVEFVPMVWGDWCPNSTPTGCPPIPLSSGATTLLGFNEPDVAAQSNMTVARALDLWPALEATGLRLGSPAVSGLNTDQASPWLDAFLAGAHQRGYRVDFLALHWYGDCNRPEDLLTYLDRMAAYGKPLWLTEFSCYHQSRELNATFAGTVTPRLAAVPQLERVAWFTNRPYPDGYEHANLVDDSGVPTSVGEGYRAIPAWIEPTRRLVN